MDAFIIVCFLILILYLIFRLRQSLTFWSKQNIPNELGMMFKFLIPSCNADEKYLTKHGKLFGTYYFLNPVLFVTDPIIIEKVLITEFHNFPDHKLKIFCENQVGSRNLFSIGYNDGWKKLRLTMNRLFTTKNLNLILPNIKTRIDALLIDKFEEVAKSGKEIEIREYHKKLILTLIIETLWGIEDKSLSDPENQFMKDLNSFLNNTSISLKHLKFLLPLKLIKLFDIYLLDYKILKFIYNVIEKVIYLKKQGKNTQVDFVKMMQELEVNNEALTETEIKDNAVLFLVNTYYSIEVALSKASYFLATNPDIQSKLCKEIDGLKEIPSFEDISSLKYLDAVFKETLRYWPMLQRIEKRAIKDMYLTHDKYGHIFLPKDSIVCISMEVFNDPDYWVEPEKFNPDRFLPPNDQFIHKNTFFPFSLGPRNCIGYQYAALVIKLTLVQTLKKFNFVVSEGTKIPLEFEQGFIPIKVPKEVTLKITPRSR